MPGSPPTNVMITTTSPRSSTIAVMWEEVPLINRNGIIAVYEVLYESLDEDERTNTTNVTGMMVELTNLKEDTNYSISVRAYSSVGGGPYSDPMYISTGMSMGIVHYYTYICRCTIGLMFSQLELMYHIVREYLRNSRCTHITCSYH